MLICQFRSDNIVAYCHGLPPNYGSPAKGVLINQSDIKPFAEANLA